MGGQQFVHPPTEIAVMLGPDGQVKLIWHETARRHAHRNSMRRLAQQIQTRLRVPVRMKHLSPGIASMNDVVARVTN
jgi:hypothetical protein